MKTSVKTFWVVRDVGTDFEKTSSQTLFKVDSVYLGEFCHNWRHRWNEFNFAVYVDEESAREDALKRSSVNYNE